ncbi:CsoS2 family carboxysome shell protein [Guyparkeria sp. TX1]|uniref:CsoS2 family carboxysome shell protein n=1 Tax=Guyparkeria sp. TX1 TaxID=3115001 RepID=UPI003977AFC3
MPVQSGNNAARNRAAAHARREELSRGGNTAAASQGGGSLAGLTGKDLARARRAQLSAHGKNASTSTWKTAASAARQNPAASRDSGSNGAAASQSHASGSTEESVDEMCSLAESDPSQYGSEADLVRSVCRTRRQAMAKYGKSALPPKPASQGGPGRKQMPFADEVRSQPKPAPASNETQADSEHEASFESLCTVAKKRPARLGPQANRVRQICQARREAMANKGKRALPAKPASQGGPGRVGYQVPGYLDTSASGREAAMRHREMLCHYGRGSSPSCRPTGRRKTDTTSEASTPKKVETGHTISGREVKGTQVERSHRVSGNESGSCRMISGTEYIGNEQYESFCSTRPQPNAPKVRTSTTASGRGVSGTAVGRAAQVTGDERGTCESVTGTEYLSSEDLQSFCGTKARPTHANKVVEGRTEKQMRVTGSDEFRPARATGGETGASRSITGSEYADSGVARMTINGAPKKVAETHTYTGRTVSGTAMGRSSHVTGDEPGTCRNVSGTQYLSFEQYESFCDTRPEPGYQKVGVDQSRQGERITGNLVDRSERVTGNEPGSCSRVTGSQYGEPRLCGGGVDKVQSMHTLAGRGLTGQRVDHHPKMSGDEQGGCMPVTGTEYYGTEHYGAYCSGSPAPHAEKVETSMTCDGQTVGGTPMDRTDHVTGNEYGYDHYVSGTPYANAMHTGCAAPTSYPLAARTQPSARYAPQAAYAQPQEPITAPEDFSVNPPARAARGRVTGSSFDQGSGRITGPGNMAMGLITGTPEFRHPEPSAAHPRMGSVMPTPTPAPQAPAPAPAPAPAAPAPTQNAPAQPVEAAQPQPEIPAAAPADAALQCAPEAQVRERVTGEGGERCRISGDDWSRNGSVTGTEGQWAQGRNPSMRGQARGAVRNAWVNREVPRPDVPASKITGSSGSDMNGSTITYSGGARG